MKNLLKVSATLIFCMHGYVYNAASDSINDEERARIVLLQERLKGITLNQDDVNDILVKESSEGHISLVDFLLNIPDGHLRPDQTGVNEALAIATQLKRYVIVEFLLNRPAGHLRPNQASIINAYREAVAGEQVDTLRSDDYEYLFCKQRLSSDQNLIMDKYRRSINSGFSGIIRLLEPLVPEVERQNQRGTRISGDVGLAHEIHNYAHTNVKVDADDLLNVKPAKPVKLIDAVWENITNRLSMTYDKAKKVIEDAIKEFIPKAQQTLAREAAFFRLKSDTDYEKEIVTAVDFIQKFHKEKLQQWLEGFVRESIEAYKNSTSSTSCSKGIKERIATGFRGIDTELDKLFKQAEAPLLIINWLKAWNLLEIRDGAKQELAKLLKAKGVNDKSTASEAAKVFRDIAKEQLTLHEVQDNDELQIEVETYAELMVEANYEKILKPFVVSS